MSIDATAAASAASSVALDVGTPGTDRAVVVFGSVEAGSSDITGVTVDGKNCVAEQVLLNTDGLGNILEAWVILESALGSSSGSVTCALVGGDTSYAIAAAKMSDVVQSVHDSGGNETATTGPAIPVTGIDVPEDGHVVAAYTQGTGSLTCTYTSPLVQDEDVNPSSADMVMASGTETAAQTNKTYTGTWSASFNRGCGAVLSFAPAPTAIPLTGQQSSIATTTGALGSEIDVGLGGETSNVATQVGALAPDVDAGLAGQSASLVTEVGTPVAEFDVPLPSNVSNIATGTGFLGTPILGEESSIATAAGTLTAEFDVPLTGESSNITTALGALGIEFVDGLDGRVSNIATAPGALAVEIADDLTGQSSNISTAAGVLAAVMSDDLVGQVASLATQVGNTGVDFDVPVTGQPSNIATGVGFLGTPILGEESSIATVVGAPTSAHDVTLPGQSRTITVQIGNLIAEFDVTLTGESSDISNQVGALGPVTTDALTGQFIGISTNVGNLGVIETIPLGGESSNVATEVGQIVTGVPLTGQQSSIATTTGALTALFDVVVVGESSNVATAVNSPEATVAAPLVGQVASLVTAPGQLSSAHDVSLAGQLANIVEQAGALETDLAASLGGQSSSINGQVGILGTSPVLFGQASNIQTQIGQLSIPGASLLIGRTLTLTTAAGFVSIGFDVPIQSASSNIEAQTGVIEPGMELNSQQSSIATTAGQFQAADHDTALQGAAAQLSMLFGAILSSTNLSTKKRFKLLIKEFRFREVDRPDVVFVSPEIRLSPENNRMELAPVASFSTADDLEFRTRLTMPLNAKRWVLMQADSDEPAGASIGYRLSEDGVNFLYWDGAAWSPAGPGDWNSETDFALNIGSFVTTVPAIQIAVNLKTTDPSVTPSIRFIKLAYESDINFQSDYIARSLSRTLRADIEGVGFLGVRTTTTTSNVDLGQIEQPYDITGVDSAYNVTDDEYKLTDLANTYDAGTKILTLSSAVPANKTIEVLFTYKPAVSITRDQDYSELSKVPAIVIEGVVVSQSFKIATGDHVVRKSDGRAFQLAKGYHADISFDLRLITGSEKDQHLLADELKRFFENNSFLRSVGQDEVFRLDLTSLYRQDAKPDQSGIRSGRLRGRIKNAVFYEQDVGDKTGVLRFLTNGGNLNLDTSPT